MEKDIYNLKLHEALTINQYEVIRVPGGWIYTAQRPQINLEQPCFVPFDNEFKNKGKTLNELFPPPEQKPKFNFKKSLIELGVSEQVASDWLKGRAKKKAANTKTAFEAIEKQIKITTHKPDDCIRLAVKKNWVGFESEWYFTAIKQPINNDSLSDMNKL